MGLPGIGPLAASESSAGRSGQRRGNIRNLCMHRQRPADIELEDLYTYIYNYIYILYNLLIIYYDD